MPSLIPDHYAVLGLPHPTSSSDSPSLSASALKRAYRVALLTHHPDKAATSSPGASRSGMPSRRQFSSPACRKISCDSTNSRPTIDAITEAYRVLSDPKLRAAHDRDFHLAAADRFQSAYPHTGKAADPATGEGLETLDLDALHFDPATEAWGQACGRCGHSRGFEVTAAELEAAVEEQVGAQAGDDGEVLVGCQGCSLWKRVTFRAVATDDEGIESGEGRGLKGGEDKLQGS